jgi:hypothetical protein
MHTLFSCSERSKVTSNDPTGLSHHDIRLRLRNITGTSDVSGIPPAQPIYKKYHDEESSRVPPKWQRATRLHGVTFQKAVIFTVTLLGTPNFTQSLYFQPSESTCFMQTSVTTELHPQIFVSLITTPSASLTNLTVIPPQSRWLLLLRKQTDTAASTTSDCGNTLIYAHMSSRTLPTCHVSLGSPTLPSPDAGDSAGLILLY